MKKSTNIIIASLVFIIFILLIGFFYLQIKPQNPISPVKSSSTPVLQSPLLAVSSTSDSANFDISIFKNMVQKELCAERSNRLYLIDKQYVFHERSGNCPDNSYSYSLFTFKSTTPICGLQDSIAGPQEFKCPDPQTQQIFDVIKNNLGKNNLGLGPKHRVEQINF